MDDAVVLPVWHYTYERVFQPYVRSVEVNGLGDPYIPFRKIWLDPGSERVSPMTVRARSLRTRSCCGARS